jgi:hypothetical protein
LNAPGLDLGDGGKGWAFQVTADKTSAKVRDTLLAITPDQRAKYTELRILVIGEKQGSYSFEGEPFNGFGFTPDMVWDFNDVCSRIMPLPIDVIQELARYIESETRRVRIELEIPDEEGKFPTSIDDLIEALPKPTLSDASKMEAHFAQKGCQVEREALEVAISELSRDLSALPRLTREVFKFMVERRDSQTAGSAQRFRISDPKLRRIYLGSDLDGDLALLSEAGLIDWNEPEYDTSPVYWRLLLPGAFENFHLLFAEYVADIGVDLRKPLVTLDFSDF